MRLRSHYQSWPRHSLRNLLVRAEMSKPNTTIGKSHSCADKRCKCCKHIYMQHSSSYTSKVTGKQYTIFCTVNCKSVNIIYILECSVCGLQYVGESKQPFHKRLNGHRSDFTKKTFLPVSQHSRLSDHSLEDFNRMKILIIEQNCLEWFSTWESGNILDERTPCFTSGRY